MKTTIQASYSEENDSVEIWVGNHLHVLPRELLESFGEPGEDE